MPKPMLHCKRDTYVCPLRQSYMQAFLCWKGLNVSVEATARGDDQLTITATVLTGNASDFALVLTGNFTNGRAGVVSVSRTAIGGMGSGLRASTVQLVQGQPVRLPDITAAPWPAQYMAITLSDQTPVVLSTHPGVDTASNVLARNRRYREAEVSKLAAYGREWSDVKDAVQTALMWSTVYTPSRGGLVTPSFGFTTDALAPTPRSEDAQGGEVVFEWDQSFVGFMFGLDSLALALSNLIAVIKMRTVWEGWAVLCAGEADQYEGR